MEDGMSEAKSTRAERIETLKGIIKTLHGGAEPSEVIDQLRELVHVTDANEIASMEQELIDEGMDVSEVQSMCDVHSQVLREIMTEPETGIFPPGHPVDTFLRENNALREAISEFRLVLDEVAGAAADGVPEDLFFKLKAAFNNIQDIEQHYMRKEFLLFSKLEDHGVTGPSKVMWGKDDEVRELLKEVTEQMRLDMDVNALKTAADAAIVGIEEMFIKEEKILFPMAKEKLTREDWAWIWKHSPEYGYCRVEPGEGYNPVIMAEVDGSEARSDAILSFPTGSLSFDQMKAILATLPLDLTFVDADDRVRFFSHGPSPVFIRSKANLGRKVQHCHPPKSVDMVNLILDDFRFGRKNVAEFWIKFKKAFVHISYFAVRDAEGKYLGCLEMTQDVTSIRLLDGERRLLMYDS